MYACPELRFLLRCIFFQSSGAATLRRTGFDRA